MIEVLGAVEEDKPGNNFNDAKCDSSGRLWCGTLGSVDINKAEKGVQLCKWSVLKLDGF